MKIAEKINTCIMAHKQQGCCTLSQYACPGKKQEATPQHHVIHQMIKIKPSFPRIQANIERQGEGGGGGGVSPLAFLLYMLYDSC